MPLNKETKGKRTAEIEMSILQQYVIIWRQFCGKQNIYPPNFEKETDKKKKNKLYFRKCAV